MEAIGGFAVFIMVLAVFAVIFIACLLYTSDAADD